MNKKLAFRFSFAENRRKKNFLIFSALMCLLVLVACGQSTPSATIAPPTATFTPVSPTITFTPTVTSMPSPTPTLPFIVRADPQPQSADPTTLVYAGPIYAVFDPPLSNGQIIQNVYETLVFYDGDRPDVLIPQLAESWDISSDSKTYTFHIRKGVKFHNGDELKPSDVAYSFQRVILRGGSDSNQADLSRPIIGVYNVTLLLDASEALVDNRGGLKQISPEKLRNACETVKYGIAADDKAGTVTIRLRRPWNAFLQTLAQPVASVMEAKWASDNDGWDGSCDTWVTYYYELPKMGPPPLVYHFYKIANGTGPFKLSLYENDKVILTRNDEYWREPAKLEKVIIKFEQTGDAILSMMKSGKVDGVWAKNSYRKQMEEFVGERCEYDPVNQIYKPCQVVDASKPYVLFTGKYADYQDALVFNYDIQGTYGRTTIGSGKLDGKGIPSTFFSDVHIRKAFAYCFDWDTYINNAYGGYAVQSTQLLPPDVLGYDPNLPHYQFDRAACEKEFKLADVDKDGIPAGEDTNDVWQTGFQFNQIYTNVGWRFNGDDVTQNVAEILAANVNSINPKFKVIPTFLPHSEYNTYWKMPIIVGRNYETVHDPYNWLRFFILDFGWDFLPSYLKDRFWDIFLVGLAERDPVKRANTYKQASLLYYDRAVGFPLALIPDDYYWLRSLNLINFNHHSPRTYFYTISK